MIQRWNLLYQFGFNSNGFMWFILRGALSVMYMREEKMVVVVVAAVICVCT